jgi:uncharacterized repeat protein (TIGR01451 family)
MLRLLIPRRREASIARLASSNRPRVEALEARRLMAVITVTGAGDAINANDGMVTLREAITASNGNANFGDAIGVGTFGADTIAFNIPGAGVRTIAPTSPLPVITDPVTIDGYSQAGSAANSNPFGQGLNTVLRVELAGVSAGAAAVGLNLGAGSAGSKVRGLAIDRFGGDGILVASNNNTVAGNFVGTDALGTTALGNQDGIHVVGLNNTIGGTVAADRNLASGNAAGSGVLVATGSGNVVLGNLIGASAAGTAALANSGGITLIDAPNNTIGGTAAGAGNVLSGNTNDGLVIFSSTASGNIVQGNLIGTNAAGAAALANFRFGAFILAPSNTIGGAVPGSGNVISGNHTDGIVFGGRSIDNALQGNKIGVALDGASPLGNVGNGVFFGEPFGGIAPPDGGNVVGGTSPGTGNTIAYNFVGVRYSSGRPGNVVLGNSIFLNGSRGIENIGPDPSPTLASAVVSGSGIQAAGTLSGAQPNSDYRIELFSNIDLEPNGTAEGRTFLGAITTHTSAAGTSSFTGGVNTPPGGQNFVTATATLIGGRTSQFATAVVIASDTTFTVTSTTESGNSLRQVIAAANAAPGAQTIQFAIPANDPNHLYYRNDGVAGQVTLAKVVTTTAANDASIADIDPDWPSSWYSIRPTSALPAISDPVVIDGTSQPGSIVNTNPVGQGLNTVLKIELDGENAGELSNGLIQITASDSTVRGLVINRTHGAKIVLAGSERIEGNFIGPDISGTVGFPAPAAGPTGFVNSYDGIFGGGSSAVFIGGTTPAARNLISGNRGLITTAGVHIVSSAPDNQVKGNLIGTDRTGMRALSNSSIGITFGSFPSGGYITVGGAEAGAGNVISGNGGPGLGGTGGNAGPGFGIRDAMIQGNFIGTDVTGTRAVGNGDGVAVSGNVTLTQNVIEFNANQGVYALVAGNFITTNTIAFNGSAGMSASGGNLVSRNAIFSNGGNELILGGRNDAPPDGDGIQNYPILGSVAVFGPGTRVRGVLDSKPSANFRFEFFANSERDETPQSFGAGSGEFAGGRTFLGTFDVTTDANGHATFTVDLPGLPAGQPFVTATATDVTDTGSGPRNSTSGFSPVAPLGGPSFVVTNTGDTGVGTLREAIINANLTAGVQTISFAIPTTDARHFYYRNDGVSGQVSRAGVAATTAASDATIADIDPDWPFSWYSIRPDRNLPTIVDTVVIDGYSQPLSRRNTLPALQALDTVLRIELDGANAPGIGLNLGLFAGSTRIDGLAINLFGGDGVRVDTLDGHVVIAGSFIGTDISGTIDLGNRGNGVLLDGETRDKIGGSDPGARNLISGNDLAGIAMISTSGALIEGNGIGPSRAGRVVIGNGGAAIDFDTDLSDRTALTGSSAVRASLAAPEPTPVPNRVIRNLIAQLEKFEADDQGKGDVMVRRRRDTAGKTYSLYLTQNHTFLRGRELSPGEGPDGFGTDDNIEAETYDDHEVNNSSIAHLQRGPSLDLGDDGSTPNDPGDLDDGPNGLQNYPVLASAVVESGRGTITGSLNSLANTAFRIEFYSSHAPDPSGFGPGERYLGSLVFTTNAQGDAPFMFTPTVVVFAGRFITSTATRIADDDNNPATRLLPIETSEFSAAIPTTGRVTANLSVSQSAAPNPARVGIDLVFTLTVANAGPDPATGVRLVVAAPAGATFVAATGGVVPVGGILTFELGVLASGASATLNVVVRPTVTGTLVSAAGVLSSTPDPTAADNSIATAVESLPPPDTVGPTISNVLLPNPNAKTTPLVLTFSEDLDFARAANLANYRLVTAGRDKKFGTRDDVVVVLRSATYNAIARTVTLLPRKKLTVSVPYRLTVDGASASGVADRAGNLLDGDRDGRVSGSYLALVKLVRPKGRRR